MLTIRKVALSTSEDAARVVLHVYSNEEAGEQKSGAFFFDRSIELESEDNRDVDKAGRLWKVFEDFIRERRKMQNGHCALHQIRSIFHSKEEIVVSSHFCYDIFNNYYHILILINSGKNVVDRFNINPQGNIQCSSHHELLLK